MTPPALKLVDHLSDLTAAAGFTIGTLSFVEYYYGDEQKYITFSKTSIGMTIASIALTATGIFMSMKSKKQ